MAGRYWREASTLILVGRASHVKNLSKLNLQLNKEAAADYNILFLKRSSRSSFMPSAYVFPGGELDKADLSPKWLSLFNQYGYSNDDIIKLLRFPGNQLEMYKNKRPEHLIPELAFRVCALRETFEETGLLLTSNNGNTSSLFQLEEKELKEWRSRVHNDASQFMNLIEHVNELPSIWRLHEWISWLTPTHFKDWRRRFDTAFYITFIDSQIPLYTHDKHEAEELKIVDPAQLLKWYYDKQLILSPPQIYELLRICNFSQFDNFQKFSEERSQQGMARWLPEIAKTTDGLLSILPGDDLYPENPDYYGLEGMRTIDKTLDELEETCKHLHRIQMQDPSHIKVTVRNIKQQYGHLNPVSTSELF